MRKIFFISIILLSFYSCNKNVRKTDLNEDEIVKIKINRFDSALILLDTTRLDVSIKELSSQFSDFKNIFFSDILDFSPVDSIGIQKAIKTYLSDSAFSKVNKDVMLQFTNNEDIESELSDAFSVFFHYYPQKKLPKIYFFVSGFNRSIYFNENIIAVGVDMYLGNNYPKYQEITYKYLTYTMQRKFVSVDVVSTLLFSNFPFDGKKDRLLDHMLYRAKVLYFLSELMSEREKTDILGYTPEQWKWCEKYEKNIWVSVVENKDLFSTDLQLIGKYLNDAPFTEPVAQESPGRLGAWVGLRIIDAFMKNNPKVTIPELMQLNDYQYVLQESNYKP